MEINEFHQADGWLFKRLDDGSVRVRNEQLGITHVVPPAEWVSIVAHVAPTHGTPGDYARAERLHQSGVLSHGTDFEQAVESLRAASEEYEFFRIELIAGKATAAEFKQATARKDSARVALLTYA